MNLSPSSGMPKAGRGDVARALAVGALAAAGALLVTAGALLAAERPSASPAEGVGVQTRPARVLLWPEGAPGSLGHASEDQPAITVYLPAANPTGTGVIIAPGGGYEHLALGHEGSDVAAWLNARGIAAFVLEYRLGPRYHNPIEAGDARRAIRLVRSRAEEWGVRPGHLGMWGFSAGGHLTAIAGTQFDAGAPGSSDVVERHGSRPDFLVLAYPVIEMDGPESHVGSRRNLLGEHPDPAEAHRMSAQNGVSRQTPPTFIFATTDDPVVPVGNSIAFYTAMSKAGAPVEMHLFAHGDHGLGLAPANALLRIWPDLLWNWMKTQGFGAESGGSR